ncbi:MAG: hypothetical protein WBF06_13185, partial [Candidatus Acidiferrales bacterium]
QRMIHRDIRGALLEIADGVSAREHHIAQQLIGVGNCPAWAVNEPRLDSAPSLHEPRAIGRTKRPDVQSFHACRALIERRFGFALAPALFHGAGVFSAAELSAQSRRPAVTNKNYNAHADGYRHRNRDENPHF